MEEIITSVYTSIMSNKDHDRNLFKIFESIKSDFFKDKILEIRKGSNSQEQRSELKLKLPCFMVSGKFNGAKTKDNLITYSQLIHLDYDKIPIEKLPALKRQACELSTTLACFISPSGRGLKVFILTNGTAETHNEVYREVSDFYNDVLGIISDPACSNINRACFMSWDSELYLNEESECFIAREPSVSSGDKVVRMIDEKNFASCIEFTNRVSEYSLGNRNNYIYTLASNSNSWGLDMEDVIAESIQYFDLNEKEIRSTIRSAYSKTADFAKFANSADFANFAKTTTASKTVPELEKNKVDSPFIPEKVYQNLPLLLKESAGKFSIQRQRDVYLTSALAILSGCLPGVEGLYGNKVIYPNLFSMILAPASSGKSVMNFSIELCRYHHLLLAEQSKLEMNEYEVELRKINANSNKENIPLPKKPLRKTLIIPGNISSSKLYSVLNNNGGKGIMAETEADTVANALRSEWGSFSELLRKSFEHERLSQSRVSEDLFIEIEVPKLSVALSGTPSQIFNIMKSAEDGLVSRFVYYYFEGDRKWRSQRPTTSDLGIKDFFSEQGRKVHSMIEYSGLNPTRFSLSPVQWGEHDRVFGLYSDQILEVFGDESVSIVNRMGQIFFRIAMILNSIRKFEGNLKQEELVCDPIDFETTSMLIETYIQHSLIVFTSLPSSSKSNFKSSKSNFEKVFEKLGPVFKRGEAVSIGETYNLSVRTVDMKLKEYVEKHLLSKPKGGTYEKIVEVK